MAATIKGYPVQPSSGNFSINFDGQGVVANVHVQFQTQGVTEIGTVNLPGVYISDTQFPVLPPVPAFDTYKDLLTWVATSLLESEASLTALGADIPVPVATKSK